MPPIPNNFLDQSQLTDVMECAFRLQEWIAGNGPDCVLVSVKVLLHKCWIDIGDTCVWHSKVDEHDVLANTKFLLARWIEEIREYADTVASFDLDAPEPA